MEFVQWNIQKKESEGCLEHFPHIKYMHYYDFNCLEKIIISSLEDMKSLYICAIDYGSAIEGIHNYWCPKKHRRHNNRSQLQYICGWNFFFGNTSPFEKLTAVR